MSPVTTILAALVAAEFLFIMYLETFATTSDRTAKVFGMGTDELARPSVNTLFKNQGVYNGLLAVLILAALAFASKAAVIALMLYIVAVAAYGSVTSNPKIILMQGGLAILCLISCLL